MSIAKVKEAVDACKDEYVTLPAAVLDAALKEAKDAGELAVHVAKELVRNPAAVVSVHKDKHLGKLCGVPVLAVKS